MAQDEQKPQDIQNQFEMKLLSAFFLAVAYGRTVNDAHGVVLTEAQMDALTLGINDVVSTNEIFDNKCEWSCYPTDFKGGFKCSITCPFQFSKKTTKIHDANTDETKRSD